MNYTKGMNMRNHVQVSREDTNNIAPLCHSEVNSDLH